MTPARPALVRGLPAVCTTLLLAGFVLAGCQQSLTTRSAPTPSELLGTAVQPIAAPVILRYGPVAGAAFTASKTGTVSVGAESRTWEDALDGALSIVPAGGGLLRVTARFEALKAELTDELDVGPFQVELMVTDRGDIRDIDYAFEVERPSRNARVALNEMLEEMFPIFEWPQGPIGQGDSFTALTVSFGEDPASSQAVDLKLDGQATRGGRLVYVVGYDGAVPFRGDVSAFSGYYLVDAETGLVVEQRHAVRTKDYRGAHLFLIDYDLETRISI